MKKPHELLDDESRGQVVSHLAGQLGVSSDKRPMFGQYTGEPLLSGNTGNSVHSDNDQAMEADHPRHSQTQDDHSTVSKEFFGLQF